MRNRGCGRWRISCVAAFVASIRDTRSVVCKTTRGHDPRMRLLGIDPGVSGAFAVADVARDGRLTIAAVHDLPVTMTTKANGRVMRRIDPAALYMMLRRVKADAAFLELVHASPGMGVSSAFSFGDTAGTIRTACTIAGVEPRTCQPTAWKRALNVPSDKALSVERATALLGAEAAAEHWPLKKHHNRAEAALLALYGAHVLGLGRDGSRLAA